jgi:hypothetical protein
MRAPLGLSDHQLHLVWSAVASLDSEQQRKRLLELIGEQIAMRAIDLEDAIDRALREVNAMQRFGDLLLPANFKIVTAEKSGTIFGIVGPPYRPK